MTVCVFRKEERNIKACLEKRDRILRRGVENEGMWTESVDHSTLLKNPVKDFPIYPSHGGRIKTLHMTCGFDSVHLHDPILKEAS